MNRFCGKALQHTSPAQRHALLRGGLMAIALAAAVAGCGTAMQAPSSGFLSSYTGLELPADEPTARRRTAERIDPAQAVLAGVEWRAGSGVITADEQAALTARLRTELEGQLRTMPAAASDATGRPVLLRAAITRVEAVSPTLNTVSALLLFVPLDRGGAAVEIEAVDAASGRQLAALRTGTFTPMTEFKARFDRLAPAQLALKKAAADFAQLLQGGG